MERELLTLACSPPHPSRALEKKLGRHIRRTRVRPQYNHGTTGTDDDEKIETEAAQYEN